MMKKYKCYDCKNSYFKDIATFICSAKGGELDIEDVKNSDNCKDYEGLKDYPSASELANSLLKDMQSKIRQLEAEKQEKVLKMAEAEIEIEKLQAENEKLKEKIDSCNDEFGCEEMAKYRKALEEISEIAYTTDFDIVDIQEIVDEVLK